MKKAIIIAFAFMCGIQTWGQTDKNDPVAKQFNEQQNTKEPLTVESIAVNPQSPLFYMNQMEAWQKRIDENPKDEWAWRNFFQATRYYYTLGDTSPHVDSEHPIDRVLKDMKKAIPDSYVYCLCSLYTNSEHELENLQRAIQLMPEDADGNDVVTLACRAWLYEYTIKSSEQNRLLKIAFEKNAIPERILRYSMNLLLSMEPNAIYFGNGDNALLPLKMLQEVYGMRRDVTILALPYCFMGKYCDNVCESLHINAFDYGDDFSKYTEKYGQEWYKHFLGDVITHMAHHVNRPVYLFPDLVQAASLDEQKIYNEGLLLKWSDQPYDNFAVAMKNVTEVYHLEYLTEPELTYTTSATSAKLDGNYVYLLGNLIAKLRQKGHVKESEKLTETLRQCIQNVRMDNKGRENLEKELQKYIVKDKK